MDREVLKEAFKSVPGIASDWYLKNESTILPIVSIASSGAAIGFAVKDSRYILDTLDTGRDVLSTESDPETRKAIYKSIIRDTAPYILRIVVFYGVSIAATIINKRHTDKKIADLTAALGLAQNAIMQYKLWQKEAERELGAEKSHEIGTKIYQEEVKNTPPTTENTVQAKQVDGPAVQTIWTWYDGNTPERYLPSRKSPVDVERWVLDQNRLFAAHKIDANKLGINAFYDFLSEGMDKSYAIPGLDKNEDYYWRYTKQDVHSVFPEIVNIDTYALEGPDGRPVNAFHCNFFPY